MNHKCKTCVLQNTLWCGGREHNFPGLEQFDFYQERKDTKEEQHG